jgi:hypothetical protein
MFHPTQPLLKRTPLRLLGFRRPAIRVLRAELARLRPPSRTIPFAGPDRAVLRRPTVGVPDAVLHGRRFADLLSAPGPRRQTLKFDGGESTARWTHSVYAFSPSRLQTLPVATVASLRALDAHLNAIPRHVPPLPHPWNEPTVRRALFRAFLSNRARTSGLRQDVVGKLKRGRRGGFWRVLRQAMVWEPVVGFRHYQGGGVEARAFVHDVRMDVLREQAGRLRREILRRLKMRRHGKENLAECGS